MPIRYAKAHEDLCDRECARRFLLHSYPDETIDWLVGHFRNLDKAFETDPETPRSSAIEASQARTGREAIGQARRMLSALRKLEPLVPGRPGPRHPGESLRAWAIRSLLDEYRDANLLGRPAWAVTSGYAVRDAKAAVEGLLDVLEKHVPPKPKRRERKRKDRTDFAFRLAVVIADLTPPLTGKLAAGVAVLAGEGPFRTARTAESACKRWDHRLRLARPDAAGIALLMANATP